MELGSTCLIELSETINNITYKLRHKLQRPLRILDLKCSQNCFSFNFATPDDEILSIGEFQGNTSLCEKLSQQLSLKTIFLQGDFLDCFATLPKKSFDLVIGLGVFNTDSKQRFEHVCAWMSELSTNATICIIGIPAQCIHDPYKLLKPFVYLEKLLKPANLDLKKFSSVYFCSNTYWYANGEIQKFASWSEVSYDAPWIKTQASTHEGTRRYYFTKDKILKHYRFTGQVAKNNQQEIQMEINFLLHNPAQVKTLPRLFNFHIDVCEAWLVRQKLSGITLTAAINQNLKYDPQTIIRTILGQLTHLESYGLYHTDLRLWNIILLDNGEASIIDYGCIKNVKSDIRHHKRHVYFSFLVFAYEVIHRKIIRIRHFNATYIHVKHYPSAYHAWIQGLLSVDFSQWSFGFLLKCLNESEILESAPHTRILENLQIWLDKAELRLHNPKFKIKYLEKRFIKYFEQRFIKKLYKELIKRPKYQTFIQALKLFRLPNKI